MTLSQDLSSEVPVLDVRNLCTRFFTEAGVGKAVEDLSLCLRRGEILGLVGESGSGKTVAGFSLMGLIDPPGRVVSGQVLFEGVDLTALNERALRKLRGNRIAMIFQDPMMTLNPVLTIGTQMIETLRAHRRISRAEAWSRARDGLARVGIAAPEERLAAYPHQLSGGMRQRVAIAIALLNEPSLIIADEPTTALDVTIQAQILAEVQRLCRETGTALIWVTHDLAVVSGLADRIAVMYAGRLVEEGRTEAIIEQPLHPYTRGLIASVPSRNLRGERLRQIPGMTPSLMSLPEGCAFAPRCDRASEACRARAPVMETPASGRMVRCFHPLTAPEDRS